MSHPEITHVEIDGATIVVSFSDQPDFRFHKLWLRDQCECSACIHAESKQKILRADQLDPDIQPTTVGMADGALSIRWSDGHETVVCTQRLAGSTAEGRRKRQHRPTLWDSGFMEHFPTFRFAEIEVSDTARFAMLKGLIDFGTVRVKDVSADEARTEQLAAMVSIIRETPHGKIYDVRTLPNVHNLAFGSDALSVHVDGSYHYYSPGPMLFHFMEVTPSGGETVLVDGFKVARVLEAEAPEKFELLCRLPWQNAYWNAGMDIRAALPPIGIGQNGDLSYVILNQYTSFPDHFDLTEVETAYDAWRHVHEIAARPHMQVVMKMEAGEALFFDNRRILHSRTAFDPLQGPRRLRSCYMERDGLHNNFRILAQKIGDPLQNAIFSTT